MSATSVPLAAPLRAVMPRVLLSGAVVGVLDGLFAVSLCMVRNDACQATRVFQGIAGGLLGRESFNGGLATAALGVALHFLIATSWSGVFFLAASRLEWLGRQLETAPRTVAAGMLYGVFVWLMMDLVIVPLSRARATPVMSTVFVILLVGHMFVVGLPIAWLARAGVRH